jgi:hypothetical protein
MPKKLWIDAYLSAAATFLSNHHPHIYSTISVVVWGLQRLSHHLTWLFLAWAQA